MNIEKEIKLKKGLGMVIGFMLFAIAALGITYAYFAGATSSSTESITSTENVNIAYSENKEYMFSGLIPASEEFALIGASKTENRCIDDNNYYVCSLYEFTVDNSSNVNQDIEVYLYQQINGYTNLKYMVYETSINDSNFDNEHKVVNSTSLVYPTNAQSELGTKIEGLTKTLTKLDSSVTTDSVTYTILFYVENKEYNQSEEDGGKQIVADVHAVSKKSGNLTNNSVPTKVSSVYIARAIGSLSTQTKYYLEDSTSQYIVFFNDYAILKLDPIDEENPFIVGFVNDGTSYTIYTSLGDGITEIPITVFSEGSSFALDLTDIGMGVLTYNISDDVLNVELYEDPSSHKTIFTNCLYYDNIRTTISNPVIDENVYRAYSFLYDGTNITTVTGFVRSLNNIYIAGEFEAGLPNDFISNYTIDTDYKSFTVGDAIYSLRESAR